MGSGDRRRSGDLSLMRAIPRILVVEDDIKIRELFLRFLRMKGYEVDEAGDGEEAIERLRRRTYVLVLLDVKMPKLDGLSALSQIRVLAPTAKILLITGFSVDPELERVLQPGVVECFHKPLTFDQLSIAIERLTASSPAARGKKKKP